MLYQLNIVNNPNSGSVSANKKKWKLPKKHCFMTLCTILVIIMKTYHRSMYILQHIYVYVAEFFIQYFFTGHFIVTIRWCPFCSQKKKTMNKGGKLGCTHIFPKSMPSDSPFRFHSSNYQLWYQLVKSSLPWQKTHGVICVKKQCLSWKNKVTKISVYFSRE